MKAADLGESLQRTLFDLVCIPSPIGEEAALCTFVEDRLTKHLGRAAVVRDGHSLVVRASRKPDAPRIALVGHLDTVRTEHDGPPRIEGPRLYGLGSSDMKSGLAVMIELAERVDFDALAVDLTLVFYEREEGPFDENRLGPLLEKFEDLRSLDLAICLEPSDNKLQLGCMGSVHATVRFEGRTAHSARPWQGDNAIVKAAPILAELPPRRTRQVDGLSYHEVISPTMAHGGRGRNVVPDVFEINFNYRFAPGRSPEEAVEELRAWIGDRASVLPTDLSPAGRPHARAPLVRKLANSGVRAVEPKQAWTDVARFDALGVTALNFGPGTQAQAHQRNEYTELPLLEEGYQVLLRFLRDTSKVPD